MSVGARLYKAAKTFDGLREVIYTTWMGTIAASGMDAYYGAAQHDRWRVIMGSAELSQRIRASLSIIGIRERGDETTTRRQPSPNGQARA